MPVIATPRHIAYGVKDESSRLVPIVRRELPQFLPKFYLYTEKGDYTERVVAGAEFNEHYGSESLLPTSKYFNHASFAAKTVLMNGGQIVVKRLHTLDKGDPLAVPPVPPKPVKHASVTLFLNISDETTAKEFERDTTGKIKRDAQGVPLLTANDVQRRYVYYTYEQGIDIKTVTSSPVADAIDGKVAGFAAPTKLSVTKYPVLSIPAKAHGAPYNDFGFRISPNITSDADLDVIAKNQFTYDLTVVSNKTGTPVIVNNNLGDSQVTGTFQPMFAHPITNADLYLGTVVDSLYGNETNPNFPLLAKMFDKLTIHNASIKEAQKALYDTMKLGDDFLKSDIRGKDETAYGLINLFTATSSTGYAYENVFVQRITPEMDTFYKTKDDKPVDISSDVPVYLGKGEDGVVEDINIFEKAVVDEVQKYNDLNDRVQVLALNPESAFIDSGYKLINKIKLTTFISRRKDLFFLGSTYSNDGTNNDQDVGGALTAGTTITAALKMFSESKKFSTPAFRACVLLGYGNDINNAYQQNVPATIDYVAKMTKYMAYEFKSIYKFDKQPNNIITELKNLQPDFIPDSAKDSLWKAGLTWFDSEDRETKFYPAQQSIYPNDTSVLNNAEVGIAICTIEKELDAIHRHYTGVNSLSNSELKIVIERDFSEAVHGRFANQFVIVPDVYFTPGDIARGFSWHMRVNFYANNSKTLMYSHVVALRKSDLKK